jgi:dihydroorotate dehydrogenase (NAD+) catalytic subunit
MDALPCLITLGQARKRELVLRSPLLVASGAGGDGEGLDLRGVGAFVTPALTAQPIAPPPIPRLARTTAGYVLHTARHNPGLRAATRRHGPSWARLGVPVLAAIYARTEDEFARMAVWLAEAEWPQGVEVHLPHALRPDQARACIEAVLVELDLPCLVRVPFGGAGAIAESAAEAGADALVVAAPPLGRAPSETGQHVHGPLHSPALAPLTAQLVSEVARAVRLPIIARGGIATARDVLALVEAGAVAVQLDSILAVHPPAAFEMHQALGREMAARGVTSWEALRQRLAGV